MARRGGGGGTASVTAAVGNDVPRVLRKDRHSAAATTPSPPPPSTAVDDTAIGSPPSPRPPSDEDRTAGWRARRDTLHSSSPRSSSSAPEEDDRGNRRGRHADTVTRRAGVSPPARALRDADAASHGAIAAVSLHVLHVVLNLIVACSSISPRPPRRPKFDCCVRFEPGGPGHVAHARCASSPRAASGSRWRSSCRRRGAASLASQRRSKARRLTRRCG